MTTFADWGIAIVLIGIATIILIGAWPAHELLWFTVFVLGFVFATGVWIGEEMSSPDHPLRYDWPAIDDALAAWLESQK